MICLSKPQVYRGFTISFDLVSGVSFTDGGVHTGVGVPNCWAARSFRQARERIDAILAEREAASLGRKGQLSLL